MSAGSFVTVNYGCIATASVHPIRVQPETLDAQIGGVANAAPPGTPILPSAQVSQSKRAIGINARTVTLKFPEGGAPAGYKEESPITIPWLDQNAAFTGAFRGQAANYLGTAAVVVGTSAEKVN